MIQVGGCACLLTLQLTNQFHAQKPIFGNEKDLHKHFGTGVFITVIYEIYICEKLVEAYCPAKGDLVQCCAEPH